MTTPQVERVGPWLLALWVGWAAAVAPVQASTQRLTQISFVCDADGHPVLEREIRVDPDTGEQSVQERRLLIDPLHPSGLSQVVADRKSTRLNSSHG